MTPSKPRAAAFGDPPIIYNLFGPLAGTFVEWTGWLDHIVRMGFNWIYVNPFHQVGGSGSLYAVRDPRKYHPQFLSYAGDRTQAIDLTGMAEGQLRYFLSEAHRRGLRVAMDLIVNHTSTDSPRLRTHPHWYRWTAGGRIVHPSCRDGRRRVVWGDLAQLDLRRKSVTRDMRAFLLDVVIHYIRLGFDGFRCDAAYKVPTHLWKFLIQGARRVRPDTVFMGETLGCSTREIIRIQGAGFNYVFNSFRWWNPAIPGFAHAFNQTAGRCASIAFPESHDTERFAEMVHGDRLKCLQRYTLAAFLSTGVLMPIGFEFGACRRLHVVRTRPQHREPPRFDLSSDLAYVHHIKRAHPVFHSDAAIGWLPLGHGVCGFTREVGGKRAVVVANLKEQPHRVSIPGQVLGRHPRVVYGLRTLSGQGLDTELVPGELFASVADA